MKPTAFSAIRDGLTIRGEYVLPDTWHEGERCPAVFMSHGFGGTWEGMDTYAVPFLEKGYAAFWFDFCGGGHGCHSDGRHEDITFAGECADLNAVIDYAKALPFVDGDDLALFGISMGGAISSLVAAQNRHAVRRLVLICPAYCAPDDARMGRLGGAAYDLNNVPETFLCPNGMVLGRPFHEEMLGIDIFEAIRPYNGEVLLIHGVADSVVPFAYAVRAKEVFGDACQLHLVPQMDHCCTTPEQIGNALRMIRLHLEDKREVLTFQVQITGAEQLTPDGQKPDGPLDGDFINAVYFTGYCDLPVFRGAIARGAVDRQTYIGGKQIQLCADYTLFGMDGNSQRCTIHVVNQGIDGNWKPTVQTDSRLLGWLNDANLTAVLEMHAGGLTVCIFG